MSNGDSNTSGRIIRARGRRKSRFPGRADVPEGSTLDFVSEGVNYKIPYSDFIAGLGVTGTLEQAGSVTSFPVLDVQGPVNLIRSVETGPGIRADISVENGVALEHNFTQAPGGTAVFRDVAAASPVFAAIAPGSGIVFTDENNLITISTPNLPVLSQVVTVNNINDFPPPVSGVITLADDTAYLISGEVTTSSRFEMGNNCAVVGVSSSVGLITYTGSFPLWSWTDKYVRFDNLLIDAPAGSVFSCQTTAPGTYNCEIVNCTVRSCVKWGTFEGQRLMTISNCDTVTAADGLTLTGPGFATVLVDDYCIALTSPTGAALDFSDSLVGSASVSRLLASGVAGSFGVSGLPSSGNISVGGTGSVVSSNFNGDITPENPALDLANSKRWASLNNKVIADTLPRSLQSFNNNGAQTTFPGVGVAVLVVGTWIDENSSLFTAGGAGRITYIGEAPQRVPIDFTVTCLMSSGGTRQIKALVALNGVPVLSTARGMSVSSSQADSASLVWSHNFQPGDYVELFLRNDSSTTAVVATDAVGRIS